MALRVLVVSSDEALRRTIDNALTQDDFDTDVVAEPGRVMQTVHGAHRPDMIVLDLALEDGEGFELGRQLRRDHTTSRIPIIGVAKSGRVGDKVEALEAGADDCVTRPIAIDEFRARVKALCRRAVPGEPDGHIRAGPIDMDLERWTITVGERPVRLTKKEFKLLHVLLQAKGRVLSRDALLDQAWPHSSIHGLDTRTVDVHVGRLRRKLGSAGSHIITVRNVGFRFDVLPEWITGHPGTRDSRGGEAPTRRH